MGLTVRNQQLIKQFVFIFNFSFQPCKQIATGQERCDKYFDFDIKTQSHFLCVKKYWFLWKMRESNAQSWIKAVILSQV